MGARQSVFTDEELDEYRDLTGLTQGEIIHAYEIFARLDPEAVSVDRNAKVKKAVITTQLPELAVNPFKERICRLFSTSGNGDMTFEDFLDMAASFSDMATKWQKIQWTFRIYDIDGDNLIGQQDLRTVLDYLCGADSPLGDNDQMSFEDRSAVVEHLLDEGDLDEDGALNFTEFQLMMNKVPELLDTFRFSL
eukprot:m.24288 g.24288  ORF g.24288 m.24288 type:complete len:193 (+) comp28590_c0_seq1:681-1259(+)